MRKPPAPPPPVADGSGPATPATRSPSRPIAPLPERNLARLHQHRAEGTQPQPQVCAIPANCLVLFTHCLETPLPDSGQRLLSIAGCATLGQHILPVLRWPWQETMPAPLIHAARECLRGAHPDIPTELCAPLQQFARAQAFIRVGTLCAIPAATTDEPAWLRALLRALIERSVQVAQWQRFDSVMVLFAGREEEEPHPFSAALAQLELPVRGAPTTIATPIASGALKLAAHEAGLEIAALLARAFLDQVEYRRAGAEGYVPLFRAFYDGVVQQWASVITEDIEPSPPPPPVLTTPAVATVLSPIRLSRSRRRPARGP